MPETSPWFSGHFPGFPVLPGIAQLDMVRRALIQATREKVRVRELRRVRFKQMILPGQTLDLVITPSNRAGVFAFRITSASGPVCTGTLEVAGESGEPARFGP